MTGISPDKQLAVLTHDAAVLPEQQFREAVASGRPLRVKLGVDPTASDVHLGWAVVLRKLRAFQDMGHQAVLIVGDFTARIGDPSGQNKTRPMLSRDEVLAHVEALMEQFKLILDVERLEVRHNSEWLEGLGVEGMLRLASHHTVARMLERDDFAKRFASEAPITITEFLYPLLQGYDSVAVEADIELGGNDQLFNLHVGRHLQIAHGLPPQALMTVPLLEGTDGTEKMSQSKGNYIAITDTPSEMFGKLMRVPDHLVAKYLRLCTDMSTEEIGSIEAGRVAPSEAKRRLASEVVSVYHGPDAARSARERFDAVFVRHEIPPDVEEADVPEDCVQDGTVHLPKLLKSMGLVPSTTEARRLVEQGGVKLDGDPVPGVDLPVEDVRGRVIQVGRRRFRRLV